MRSTVVHLGKHAFVDYFNSVRAYGNSLLIYLTLALEIGHSGHISRDCSAVRRVYRINLHSVENVASGDCARISCRLYIGYIFIVYLDVLIRCRQWVIIQYVARSRILLTVMQRSVCVNVSNIILSVLFGLGDNKLIVDHTSVVAEHRIVNCAFLCAYAQKLAIFVFKHVHVLIDKVRISRHCLNRIAVRLVANHIAPAELHSVIADVCSAVICLFAEVHGYRNRSRKNACVTSFGERGQRVVIQQVFVFFGGCKTNVRNGYGDILAYGILSKHTRCRNSQIIRLV